MAKLEVREHLGTADVEIAPLHARGLVGLDAIFDGERRRDRFVQHFDRAGEHLDLACHHVGVDGVFAALAHLAGKLQHVFTAEVLGSRKLLGGDAIGVDDNLSVAIAVAQVDENQTAVVAVVPRPTGQRDLTAAIFLAQLTACSGMHAVFVLQIGHLLNSSSQYVFTKTGIL